MRNLRATAFVAASAIAVSAGCGSQVEVVPGTPAPPPVDTTTPVPRPPAQPAIALSTHAAAPGEEVEVTARNFAPGATVRIGFGLAQSEYEVIRTVTADGTGTASAMVTVPTWAESGRSYVFVAAEPDNDPRVISGTFHVTSDGLVTVEGRITTEGVECLALRTDRDELYTLTGDTGDFGPGDRVEVRGTLPAMSICQQGTTISVESIRRAGG
jgi:hypothetical protein